MWDYLILECKYVTNTLVLKGITEIGKYTECKGEESVYLSLDTYGHLGWDLISTLFDVWGATFIFKKLNDKSMEVFNEAFKRANKG